MSPYIQNLNIGKTALLLILTLVIFPAGCFYFEATPGQEEWVILRLLLKISLAVAALCFIVSEITGNYPQVDKLWSLLPILYVWIVNSSYGF